MAGDALTAVDSPIDSSGQWVWMSLTQVARTVHTDPRRLTRAMREEGITPHIITGTHWISRPMLRALASRRPKVFAGLTELELTQLLDSETMAAELAAMGMQRYRRFRPVVCVETGKRYESIREAARSVYLDRTTIGHALKNNGTVAGLHWRYAD
jgi:carbamoylphosphate synthase small subunit